MDFFSKILKQKKILFLAFLILVILGNALPLPANADNAPTMKDCYRFKTTSADPGDPSGVHWGCLTEFKPTDVNNDVFSWKEVGQELIGAIGVGIVRGAWTIAVYASYLLSYIVDNVMSKAITTDKSFTLPWQQVRNLANMVIVLGFVVIGIATSLRIREYEAKKLLWPLILAALLVNFSGLFCGLIIDASNLITTGLGTGSGVGMGETLVKTISDTSIKFLTTTAVKENPGAFIANACFFAVVFLAAAFTLLYLSALLLARYAVLIILFILSPLAVAFWVFPASKKLWTDWWTHFLRWAFVGVMGAFVMWLAAIIMQSTTMNIVAGDEVGLVTNISIVLIFLYVGFKMTAKSNGIAAMAGGAIIGLAGGAAGFVAGAAVGGAKVLGRGADAGLKAASGGKASFSGAAQRISSGTGRMMENIGLRAQGTTAQNFQKGMDETGKRVGGMDEKAKTGIATGSAFSARSVQDKVAAIQDKVKNGRISDLGATPVEQGKNIAYAESYLKNRGMAGATTIRKDALKQNPNIGNPTELREAVQKQTPGELTKNLDSKAFTPEVLSAMNDKQMINMANKGSVAKKNAMRDLVNTPEGATKVRGHISSLITNKKHDEAREAADNYKSAQKLF